MPRDARFWRNVTIIAVAHVAIVVALVRWNREIRKPAAQSIVWMSGGGLEVASETPPTRPESTMEATSPPETGVPHSKAEEQDEAPVSTSARSDIQIPAATPSSTPAPTPTSKPRMTPAPKASPKPATKPTPKTKPKKLAAAKVTPKSTPRKEATPVEQKKEDDAKKKEAARIASAKTKGPDGDKSGPTGPGDGVRASEFSWYGKMLHDRFFSEWIQPRTSVAVGKKMSALVRIHIEKSGRVSKFTIVRPSGNIVVDESVAAVAKRVTQVDPLPKGLASGTDYEVNITFELNPEQ